MAPRLQRETPVGLPRSSLVKSRSLPPPTHAVERLEFAPTQLDMSPPPSMVATNDLTGPTPEALLQRAAELGPARLSWESIVTPDDPILQAKSTAEVAERRARLRRVVKGMLGACGGLCLIALVVTIVSGGPESSASAATLSPIGNAAPAKMEIPITKMDTTTRTKAAPAAPLATMAARRFAPAPKRR
jgi:hypothetical protein